MPIPPVPDDHTVNRRDDEHEDFARLRSSGLVRDKRGKVIRIDKPHSDFSALDRDKLFQAYVAWRAANPSADNEARWIADRSAQIISAVSGKRMSPKRAQDIIGQGSGCWDSRNSMWWRGVSVS